MSSTKPACGADCLEFLGEGEVGDAQDPCYRSASRGHLDCLRVAHSRHPDACPVSAYLCEVAIVGGHLDCLRYAHEHGCPWSPSCCLTASEAGHLECLRYAHENGAPWDETVCAKASREGHLECLRYAHEKGAPWDYWSYVWATSTEHLDCLQYILENGGPTCDLRSVRIGDTVLPCLYHRGLRIADDRAKHHVRLHVRSSWALLRCVAVLLRMYRETCERVYSPDGVGYQEAELSFRALCSEKLKDTPIEEPE